MEEVEVARLGWILIPWEENVSRNLASAVGIFSLTNNSASPWSMAYKS